MTEFTQANGNLLKADVDALANTVNTVGVMGKGIALQFKNAFPANFKAYAAACKKEQVALGKMFVFDDGQLLKPRWIINFPTKGHWRSRSRLVDIECGLDDLRRVILELEISSIALPPLGCGNGGLEWSDVRPLIEKKLDGLDVVVHLYAPAESLSAEDMVTPIARPKLTPGRAALVSMVDKYSAIALGASLLEIQKLMYFLQEAGQGLQLRYEKGIYGPYADNLRHVVKALEGHYLQGFGDGSSKVLEAEPIRVLPGAVKEANEVLADDDALVERMDRVLDLIAGYESSYGLELLASVHWVATRDSGFDGLDRIVEQVQSWSQRKQSMFTDSHIETAWDRIREQGWLTEVSSHA